MAREFPFRQMTAIDGRLYDEILAEIQAIFGQHFDKVMPMYTNPPKMRGRFGWHLLLSHDEADADYLVMYETTLFPSVAQARFLHDEIQLQYTLEPGNVILFSQFRISCNDDDDLGEDDPPDGVLSICEPVSDTEARGLLSRLKNIP